MAAENGTETGIDIYFKTNDGFYFWQLMSIYEHGIRKYEDPRTKDWLLMGAYWPTLALSTIYILMTIFLPRCLKNVPAMSLRGPLILYNACVVYLNAFILYESLVPSIRRRHNLLCTPVNFSTHPDDLQIASGVWWYYFSKVIEFADTLFFILRKKNDQITFLHVYHHSTMFPIWWLGVKFAAAPMAVISVSCNSFVHVVMYTYYGLAACGPSMQKYLWWKRYLTKLQLLQFWFVLGTCIWVLLSDCDFYRWMIWTLLFYMISMLILFGNFYRKAYLEKQRIGREKRAADELKSSSDRTQSYSTSPSNSMTNGSKQK